MGRRRLNDYEKKQKAQKKTEFVPADPRCEQCYYWRYLGGVDDESINCCHFALFEGKLRERVSETECGSFKDKKTATRKRSMPIPMNQWGCGGLGISKRIER